MIRNIDKRGPLRSKEHPAGNESIDEVRLGSRLWRHTLGLCWLCLELGLYFCIEHPRGSYAWHLPETHRLMNQPGVRLVLVEGCAFDSAEVPMKKPNYLLSNAPWTMQVCKLGPGGHVHANSVGVGKQLKAAAACPPAFCSAVATSFSRWVGDGSR